MWQKLKLAGPSIGIFEWNRKKFLITKTLALQETLSPFCKCGFCLDSGQRLLEIEDEWVHPTQSSCGSFSHHKARSAPVISVVSSSVFSISEHTHKLFLKSFMYHILILIYTVFNVVNYYPPPPSEHIKEQMS